MCQLKKTLKDVIYFTYCTYKLCSYFLGGLTGILRIVTFSHNRCFSPLFQE